MLAVSIRVKRLFANDKDMNMNDPEVLCADKIWIFRIQKMFLNLAIFPLN